MVTPRVRNDETCIRNGGKRKTCQEDLVPYSSSLSHLAQCQIADNVQSHLCQETLPKVPVQSTKCNSTDVLLLARQNSYTMQLWCSLSMPQFFTESGLMAQANTLFLKKKKYRKDPKAVNPYFSFNSSVHLWPIV